MTTPNPTIVKVVTPPIFSIADITTGTVAGTGVFDQLMRGINSQLELQFKAGRITATEFSGIYTEALKQVLATASTLSLEKAKQAYELTLMDLQVQAAREDLKTSQINQEKIRKEVALLDREITRVDVQTDMLRYELQNKLPVEVNNLVKQGEMSDIQRSQETFKLTELLPLEKTQITEQINGIVKEIAIKDYQLNNMMPVEVANATKQGEMIEQQTLSVAKEVGIKDYQLSALLPNELARGEQQIDVTERTTLLQENQSVAQVAEIVKSTEIKDYQLTQIMPVELTNLTKQGVILDSQKEAADSQLLTTVLQREVLTVEKNTAIYKLETVMPIELANVSKQGEILDQDLLTKPVERSLLEAEGLIKDKQLDVMDSQIEGQVSQTALYDQKTLSERANVDGSVIGTDSLFDKQRQLLIEQHETFIKDAKQKVGKMLIDAWGIKFNEDPGAAATGLAGLHDPNIKLAVEELLTSVGITPNTYVPPVLP